MGFVTESSRSPTQMLTVVALCCEYAVTSGICEGRRRVPHRESPSSTSEDQLTWPSRCCRWSPLTLLQLRDASRHPNTNAPGHHLHGPLCAEVLSLWRHKKVNLDWTVHELYYALARLGGHQIVNTIIHPGKSGLGRLEGILPMVTGYDVAKTGSKNVAKPEGLCAPRLIGSAGTR